MAISLSSDWSQSALWPRHEPVLGWTLQGCQSRKAQCQGHGHHPPLSPLGGAVGCLAIRQHSPEARPARELPGTPGDSRRESWVSVSAMVPVSDPCPHVSKGDRPPHLYGALLLADPSQAALCHVIPSLACVVPVFRGKAPRRGCGLNPGTSLPAWWPLSPGPVHPAGSAAVLTVLAGRVTVPPPRSCQSLPRGGPFLPGAVGMKPGCVCVCVHAK